MNPNDLLPRAVMARIDEALADTRVVALNGARQCGKSTLARGVAAARPGATIKLLDDQALLAAARDDPAGFVHHDGLMVIDEIQLAPQLFSSIKVTVDLDPRPGRFLLTGSAQLLALRDLPDSLTGRIEIIELFPFAQCELDRNSATFVDAAFTSSRLKARESSLSKRDYLELVARGGFPEVIGRNDRRRGAFFESYLATLIERDVSQLSQIERRGELRRLLTLLAGRAGQLLVPSTLASASGLPRSTLVRYLELLRTVFLIKEIPAWTANTTGRAIGTPKLAFVDSGLACYLLGQDASRLSEPGGAAGPLLESFVLMEIQRQLTWSQIPARLYHYRTKDGLEVDGVIEALDGSVVGVEVKAGATIHSEDLRGLRHLATRLGERFVGGYVLYTGKQTLSFGNQIFATPLDSLWPGPWRPASTGGAQL